MQIFGVLAHAGQGAACAAPENGKRRTGNRTPLRGDEWGRRESVEGLPCGADTKGHEEPRRGVKVNSVRGNRQTFFSARTSMRAKPDGLTSVALRVKRPLIAPSRPSSSRLKGEKEGCGATTKEHKGHKDCQNGNRRFRRF